MHLMFTACPAEEVCCMLLFSVICSFSVLHFSCYFYWAVSYLKGLKKKILCWKGFFLMESFVCAKYDYLLHYWLSYSDNYFVLKLKPRFSSVFTLWHTKKSCVPYCCISNRRLKESSCIHWLYCPRWHLSWVTISSLAVRPTWAELH